ncbi:MAG: hypothetical protein Kow0089_25060 [Desulfobulbaceae bacterium]
MFALRDDQLKHIFLYLLGGSVLAIVLANLFIYPRFTDILTRQTEKVSVILADHISSMLFPENSVVSKDAVDRSHALLERLIRELDITTLKIFLPDGTVIYATDRDDIGTVNEHAYFHTLVAAGKVYSKLVRKDTRTAEGKRSRIDIVETYVPVMREGRFSGALEVYFDNTEQFEAARRAILVCNIAAISFFLIFLGTTLLVARRLDENISERDDARRFLRMVNLDLKQEIEQRKKTEEEKAALILQLEETILQMRVLKGLVPICSFCKNIRNDAGYWEKIEEYVEKYSDAEFSHGLCPDCAAKQYPGLHLDEDDEEPAEKAEEHRKKNHEQEENDERAN